jgi:hypothetical protein
MKAAKGALIRLADTELQVRVVGLADSRTERGFGVYYKEVIAAGLADLGVGILNAVWAGDSRVRTSICCC